MRAATQERGRLARSGQDGRAPGRYRRDDGKTYLFVHAATTEIGEIEFRLNPTDEEVDAVWRRCLTVHRTGDTLGS